ncbi:MAG: DNA polymerase/3'-5' exonuclease PolX [Candidatus Pacebacteria bacterium]|nr:DNA polymerase/3'-5' exonuclease PolX [Candidatus Paceibacterota bacterium]MDD4074210.1 DNA polymerase/3'-5' exonuclease PolX [Candidatus Paceibacterota bacterium]
MKNQELAELLFEIGDFLDLGEVPFKPDAYKKAAIAIDSLEEDIFNVYKKDGIKGLEKINGVGKSIALKIEEFIKTGKIKYYKELKKESPINLEELKMVEGLGVRKIKKLWQELKIRNLKDLEKAIEDHKVSQLFGFGDKTEKNILESIKFLRQGQGRFVLRDILEEIEKVEEKIKKIKEVVSFSIAGSARRKKETIGDVDFLVAIKDVSDKYVVEKIMNTFAQMDSVVKIIAKGETKTSIKIKNNLNMDLRLVSQSSFGAALQYFTGSKEHNIALRRIAMKKGYKLNEYGLFRGEAKIEGEYEEKIYERLGLKWIPPELRENQGEIEMAIKNELPELVELEDIKGDLHCHTNWNGGKNSIEELAKEAINLGYSYIGINDHTKSLKIENGLDEKRIKEQRKEIDILNKSFKDFKILQGSEVDILADGSLDINNETLKTLDYVSISVHSGFKMNKKDMTKRVLKAMDNHYVKILNHPTGMIVNKREGYNIDIEAIINKALKNNIAIEINSYRGDLNSQFAKLAKERGVKLVINSDAHDKKELKNLEFGLYIARRAYLTKNDILNTYEKI